MKPKLLVIFIVASFGLLEAQEFSQLSGRIIDARTQGGLSGVLIQIENTNISVQTDINGYFSISQLKPSQYILIVSRINYKTKRLNTSTISQNPLDLGAIPLQTDFTDEVRLGLISLTEDDLNDEDYAIDNTAGILQASKDLFQRRAAFDFSQAYFRPRGFDSKYSVVLINGLEMNRLFNARPQWSNWGGLNDVLRNQELSYGLNTSKVSFGSLLGVTNLIVRPSLFRAGTRISYSYSNRTYGGRAMITHNSGLQKNGWSYSFSASRRWGREGFIDGTPYDAFSIFGGIEFSKGKNSVALIGIYAPNTRGSVAAVTARVYERLGRKYNPNWGLHDGQIRSSRLRRLKEPVFMFNHTYRSDKLSITTNVGYQGGERGSSRLDYINAPNPYPNYWRYLNGIEDAPQIAWSKLYDANLSTLNVDLPGAARYLLYEDKTEDNLIRANTLFNIKIGNRLKLDAGASFSRLFSDNYAIPLDLLGAAYYKDVNPFNRINGQPTRNDLNGKTDKGINDRIKYNYNIYANQTNSFLQLQLSLKKLAVFISSNYRASSYQREGLFRNESFLDNSLGKSHKLTFSNFGVKMGFLYKVTGRHLLSFNGAHFTKAPSIRNSFINVRENNLPLNDLKNESISALEVNYIVRTGTVNGRLSGYYASFKKETDLNFIFAQIGSGTDFFQEAVTGIKKRHLGLEMGLELPMNATTTLSAAASIGSHYFSGNPKVRVNFDALGFIDGQINDVGFKDLGHANMKKLSIANGPQQVYSIGLEYKDPNYWWIAATANYLSHAYADPATIRRTSDFFIDPDDPQNGSLPFIDQRLANKLLEQEKFAGFYLLNFNGGKSFKIKRNYLNFFVSINNVFESEFKTGGYEQSRTSTYESLAADVANGNSGRQFGNKYWYGLGRTFFVNLAYTF